MNNRPISNAGATSAFPVKSVCPYDCPDSCGLLVWCDNGRAVKVQGDPDHPITRGSLCYKMAHYERTVHSSARILTPLRRTGPKGAGSFAPLPWDEAVHIIASRWQDIIADHGAAAIAPISAGGTMGLIQRNAGHPLFNWLGASRMDRGICAPALDYGWKAVMGGTQGTMPQEAQYSDFIILWGTNTAVTNSHFLIDVQAAKRQGAKVWLIDTYRQPTSGIADRIGIIRPGSDGMLALAIMHILIRDNLIDTAFINRCTLGFAELARAVTECYTPSAASVVTGLAVADIEELAATYGRARAPFIRLGCGLSRYGNGSLTVRAIVSLPALVGAWAKPGGGLLARSYGGLFDMSVLTRDDLSAGDVRQLTINRLGDVLALTDAPVMSLYIYSANPAVTAPDQNAVLAGLARDDLFTVVHERWITDTARYADIILPATTSLEHSDIYRAAGHFVAARVQAAILPPGQAKSNWQTFSLLAQALGMTDGHYRRDADELIDELLARPSAWWSAEQLAALRAGQAVELQLTGEDKVNIRTPSGRIQLISGDDDNPLPLYHEPYGGPEEFWFVSSPDRRILNSSFNERPDLTAGDKMVLLMNPDDALRKQLTDGQLVRATNSNGGTLFMLRVTPVTPPGTVVCEGVWPLADTLTGRSVNALTWQRLTDRGNGSTFYDVKVDVTGA